MGFAKSYLSRYAEAEILLPVLARIFDPYSAFLFSICRTRNCKIPRRRECHSNTVLQAQCLTKDQKVNLFAFENELRLNVNR